MPQPIRILLQTTIPTVDDDWHVGRFALLAERLGALADDQGRPLARVTTRDRVSGSADDPVLAHLDTKDFDEVWLFAVDVGHGLTARERAAIAAFQKRGGGVLTARDHQDLGCSLCGLEPVGAAHHFHQHQPEADPERQSRDDQETTNITWPNYHTGRNGDFQRIVAADPIHELLRDPGRPGGLIQHFPAHPHEGAVSAPASGARARVVASGVSRVSGRRFGMIVAFDRDETAGRAGRGLAHSSFHHFADYNWDPRRGSPSFVTEAPGTGMLESAEALADIHAYVRNAALWLAPPSRG